MRFSSFTHKSSPEEGDTFHGGRGPGSYLVSLPSFMHSFHFQAQHGYLSSKRRKSRMEGMFPSIKSTSQKSPTSLPFTYHGPELRYPATPSHNRGRTIPTSLVAATHPAKNQGFYYKEEGDNQLFPDMGMSVLFSECVCPAC